MANTNRANGLVPVSTISGAGFGGHLRKFAVDSSNGTAIFRGDLVMIEDDGNVAPATAGSTAIIGVCMGPVVSRAVAATEHPGYLPASTAGNILVLVGRDVLYEIQEDSVGGAMVATNVGSVGDHVAGAGSTTTGRSGHVLDSSDVIAKDASAAAAGLYVFGLIDRPDNEVGNYARWLVKLNEIAFADGTAGL
jgi:hypothetical protein